MNSDTIANTIIALKNNDLQLRDELLKEGRLSDGYDKAMEELHAKNATKLNEIIDRIGYPTIDMVGKEAAEAAWLVIQHSISHPAFMKRCAELLEIAVSENKADPIHFAYLIDRIAVFEGNPQLYGTQFDWDKAGKLSPNLYDDLAKVNQRRASLGLNTLENQTTIMRSRVMKEKQSPPKDLQKRQQEMENWKIKVGWII